MRRDAGPNATVRQLGHRGGGIEIPEGDRLAQGRATSAHGRGRLVYQVLLTLQDVEPPVWRRLLVPGGTTLKGLHDDIQAAMGWYDAHLHEFQIDGVRYGIPDEEDDWDEEPLVDDRRVRLSRVAGEDSQFLYLYDFGDDWHVDVLVEKVFPAKPDERYPTCIDGRRAGPPQGCGGPFGYAELIEVLANPADPRHSEYREWVGGFFEPEAFDPADFEVNRRTLRAARRNW